MPQHLEDYAMIGDCQTAALVGRDGSIDWLCVPRFDSDACFSALLGTPEHGRWLIAPKAEARRTQRRYREGTLILETEFETSEGAATLIDFMPLRGEAPDVVRIVVGKRGTVPFHTELVIRFGYGSIVPWVRAKEDGLRAIAGPDSLYLRTPVKLRGENFHSVADFSVQEGQRIPFTLTWQPSHQPPARKVPADVELDQTQKWWDDWSARCTYQGQWRKAVLRSLITLRGLIYEPTGGIVAAPTTSLPEQLGGVRNWDYRYSWLRDATLTLNSLLVGGYHDEAQAWRDWLLRAVAGKPSQIRIMYGMAGERRLSEWDVPWLPGYERSSPVRIGNAASEQLQLDVFGEVLDSLHLALRMGVELDDDAWQLEQALLDHLESEWKQPDRGIWEVRGTPRQFTLSKVMAWVAFDRGVKTIECCGVEGPSDRWKQLRDEIHREVCQNGFDPQQNSFVQSFGSQYLDASLLYLPLAGFLPANDPRMVGTVTAIEKELTHDGFLMRYPPDPEIDGLPPGEGTFLACNFWYVDNLTLQGRKDEARQHFERLLGLANDVGLLSEEYDPKSERLVGNFPQAFSHVGLINSARNLSGPASPAEQARQGQMVAQAAT